jgi:tetratricopeptide (TPR) repeat protein
LLSVLTLLVPVSLVAQSPRLGTISFPTSGSPAAQEHFIRGVLFLHSFEYGSAAEAFREAQQADPDFAMAYWGEAMTYNHPIWDERDRDAALAALERLAPTREGRLAKAPTERERAFLEAVETLYQDGPKAQRDTAYSLAMERVATRFPDDPETRAFYSLSLLGLSSGVRVTPTYMRAAAIVEEVFDANPNHPGAVHYLIHSYDDPVHAPLGLRAARVYSQIAPDAAHAQHMTTHIFVAMGMWDQVVSQNELAAELTWWGPGHYTYWLGYGLLQGGRWQAARRHLERAGENLPRRPGAGSSSYFALMRAHDVVNAQRWDDPELQWTIDLSGAWPTALAADAFVQGFAALRRGADDRAARELERLSAVESDRSQAPRVLELELRGLMTLNHGDTNAALILLREATDVEDAMPVEFGPPDVVKPSHELLGEIFLQLNRPAEAQREFERALALAPNRALSLVGLGRAAAGAGDHKTAQRAHNTLREVWHAADEEVGMLDSGF